MATRLEQWSKEEVHTVIRFLHARHVSAAKIHHQLIDIYGEEVKSCRIVVQMCSHFKCGRNWTRDNERSGRLTRVSTPQNTLHVEAAIFNSKPVTVTQLDHDLGLLHGTIVRIIQWFGFDTLCARCTFTLVFEDAILTNFS